MFTCFSIIFVFPNKFMYSVKSLLIISSLLIKTQAKKPSYQLGSSAPINLGRASNFIAPLQPGPSRNTESAKIWTLAANDMLDDDVVSFIGWVWLGLLGGCGLIIFLIPCRI